MKVERSMFFGDDLVRSFDCSGQMAVPSTAACKAGTAPETPPGKHLWRCKPLTPCPIGH